MWQPIETAPKDGSSILLSTPKGRIADGFWHVPYKVWSWPYVMVEPTHWMPLPDAPGAQAQPAPSVPEGWLRAIDEALVVTHLGVANADDSYEDAKRKLNELIGWHVAVATDPAVNGGFKLVPAAEQPAPSVPEGWIQRGIAELEAIRSNQDDAVWFDDRMLIERIGKAMLAEVSESPLCP